MIGAFQQSRRRLAAKAALAKAVAEKAVAEKQSADGESAPAAEPAPPEKAIAGGPADKRKPR